MYDDYGRLLKEAIVTDDGTKQKRGQEPFLLFYT